MSLRQVVMAALWLGLFCVDAWTVRGDGADLHLAVARSTGGIEALAVDGKEMKFAAAEGGFKAYDAAAKTDIVLGEGSVEPAADKTVFRCQKAGDLRLTAEFVRRPHYVRVNGWIENLQPGERGIVLDYRIPLVGDGAVFSNELNRTVHVDDAAEEGNVYPIAAMCDAERGVAMAIPPSEPRTFGMVGSRQGLSIRFYLGVSPQTRNFPNRAPFVFIIYPVEPAWGFRSAIGKYYDFYPDYYRERAARDGLYLFLSEDGRESELPDPQYFVCQTVETQAPWFQAQLARNADQGILSLAYMIVGQREI
jgi:hypothetical protein